MRASVTNQGQVVPNYSAPTGNNFSNGLGVPIQNPGDQGGFSGKSMRSIELFGNNSAASPPLLHPAINPTIQAESPRSKRLGLGSKFGTQSAGGFSLLPQ